MNLNMRLLKMLIVNLMMFFILLLCQSNSYATEFSHIDKVQVIGLQNLNKNTFVNLSNCHINNKSSYLNVKNVVLKMHKNGIFNHIICMQNKNSFFFTVKEKPILLSILVSGNINVNNFDILNDCNKIGIIKNHVLNTKIFNDLKNVIFEKYKQIGYFNTKIKINYFVLSNNMVIIRINILEGQLVFLKNIYIIGNKNFHSNIIINLLHLYPNYFQRLFIKFNVLNNHIFKNDLNDLKNMYYKNGYVDFYMQYVKYFIDKNNLVSIVIKIHEGKKYNISSIHVYGHLLNNFEIIQHAFFALYFHKIYNINEIFIIKYKLDSIFFNLGFLNFKIFLHPIFDKKNQSVILNLNISFGKVFFINKIFFTGNCVTKNYVLYNIIHDILNCKYVNLNLIEKARYKIEQTGYFKSVLYSIQISKNDVNKVNIIYKLQEKKSNFVNFNLGYNFSNSINMNIKLQNNNCFGYGIKSEVFFLKNYDQSNISCILKYPNFIYHINFNNYIYYNTSYVIKKTRSLYDAYNYGLDENLEFIISNQQRIKIGISLINHSFLRINHQLYLFNHYSMLENQINDIFINTHEKSSIFIKYNYMYNTIKKSYFPISGNKLSINSEISIPGVYNNFYKEELYINQYCHVFKHTKCIVHNRFFFGFGSMFSVDDFPFYENFYISNKNSIRGFVIQNFGLKLLCYNNIDKNIRKTCFYKNHFDSIFGGNCYIVNKLDLIIPNFFIFNKNYDSNFRTSIFFDFGNLWNTNWKNTIINYDYKINNYNIPKDMYVSTGMNLEWISPIGILDMSYSYSLSNTSISCIEPFQFKLKNSW